MIHMPSSKHEKHVFSPRCFRGVSEKRYIDQIDRQERNTETPFSGDVRGIFSCAFDPYATRIGDFSYIPFPRKYVFCVFALCFSYYFKHLLETPECVSSVFYACLMPCSVSRRAADTGMRRYFSEPAISCGLDPKSSKPTVKMPLLRISAGQQREYRRTAISKSHPSSHQSACVPGQS
jgi:hypothetical protein